jgi:hypothetical protein
VFATLGELSEEVSYSFEGASWQSFRLGFVEIREAPGERSGVVSEAGGPTVRAGFMLPNARGS